MKVYDLQCALGHSFEGWFGSEQDFVSQCARSQVQCPLCGDPTIAKMPSAPRLNLTAKCTEAAQTVEPKAVALPSQQPAKQDQTLATVWMALARQIVANTTDVGDQFAQEARKMHYGETDDRSIRGRATAQETQELLEEGISVMPLVLPESLKNSLQ